MRQKILVVDDDENMREMVSIALQTADYEIITACNGKEALELVAAAHPGLVILDVMMPKMDGFEVFRQLRENEATHELPVIMLTALSDTADASIPEAKGLFVSWAKPFIPEDLLRLVENIFASETSRTHPTTRPGKILVVDDSQELREMMQALLEREGYHIITAGTGRAVFQQMLEEKPDLVVLDVMMPHLNGFEVLRNLNTQAATRGTPVILVTAKTSDHDMTLGAELGATAYVTKPFDPAVLMSLIRRILQIQDHPIQDHPIQEA